MTPRFMLVATGVVRESRDLVCGAFGIPNRSLVRLPQQENGRVLREKDC